MYKPTALRNFYLDTRTPAKRRVSKTLIAFLFLVQFAFGLDCGLVKWFSKKYRCFLKFVSTGITLWTLIVNAAPLSRIHGSDNLSGLWALLSFLQYVSFVLVLKFSKLSVYDFLIKINIVSYKNDTENEEILGALAFVYAIVVFITKVPVFISSCLIFYMSYCDLYVLPYPVVAVYSLCTDCVPIIMVIIACHKLRIIMNMRETLKKPDVNVDVTKKFYIDVANVIDEISPLYHNLMMVKLIAELPKILASMYFMSLLIKLQASTAEFAGEFIYVIHAIIQISMPAIVAEMLKAETEQIKLDLHNLMIAHDEDVKLKARVHSLLGYMEVRRLQDSAWRFVPVDLRLPVSLCGLCTTYFIVILQFTHLID